MTATTQTTAHRTYPPFTSTTFSEAEIERARVELEHDSNGVMTGLIRDIGELVSARSILDPLVRAFTELMNTIVRDRCEINRMKDELAAKSPADRLRAEGWAVAVHKDYRMHGAPQTFWLFTKDGKAIKGEGASDDIALNEVLAQIGIGTATVEARRAYLETIESALLDKDNAQQHGAWIHAHCPSCDPDRVRSRTLVANDRIWFCHREGVRGQRPELDEKTGT